MSASQFCIFIAVRVDAESTSLQAQAMDTLLLPARSQHHGPLPTYDSATPPIHHSPHITNIGQSNPPWPANRLLQHNLSCLPTPWRRHTHSSALTARSNPRATPPLRTHSTTASGNKGKKTPLGPLDSPIWGHEMPKFRDQGRDLVVCSPAGVADCGAVSQAADEKMGLVSFTGEATQIKCSTGRCDGLPSRFL